MPLTTCESFFNFAWSIKSHIVNRSGLVGTYAVWLDLRILFSTLKDTDMKNITKKPLAAALGAAFVTSMAFTPMASADTNPFGVTELETGYMVLAEGKCGDKAAKKAAKAEAKCGEGKCGEGKCGANNAADTAKKADGSCGANKAADTAKKAEGKCGEGKCGEKK